jgi:hypothetical protein
MALSPGARLGPYEITGLLGVGGMGEVYRARDPRLGREVAVKVLPPGSSGEEDRIRRFEQEARAAEPQFLRGQGVRYENAIWFPDGKRILANGREEGGLVRSYVQGVQGGKPRPMTPEATVCGALSPDGKQAACTDANGQGLLYPVEGGEPQPISGFERGDVPVQWSSDGRSLYTQDALTLPLKVFQVDLRTGNRELFREVMPTDRTGLVASEIFRMTPDGKSYAYSTFRYPSDLYLVDGLK